MFSEECVHGEGSQRSGLRTMQLHLVTVRKLFFLNGDNKEYLEGTHHSGIHPC